MDKKIYILGCGAIGLTVAAHLSEAGREVSAVRTGTSAVTAEKMTVTVHRREHDILRASIETTSLSRLARLDGLIVVSAKSYANPAIAAALIEKNTTGPLVLLQNGLGVEKPFVEAQLTPILRCVLYATAQLTVENTVTFRPIASSPIGVIAGSDSYLKPCVTALTTSGFPFHAEPDIQRDIWKKSIINVVFNSLCPLLEVDNGIFAREPAVAALAVELVRECVVLARVRGITLAEPELLEQIQRISSGSAGVFISTLQDLRHGRPTEIDSLNLEMARLASSLNPPINLARTEFLGKMIMSKAKENQIRKLEKT